MLPSTVAAVSYLMASVGLLVRSSFKRRTPKIDFEVGVAVGLAIAGLLDLLIPLVLELP
jgi:hypothetical protein